LLDIYEFPGDDTPIVTGSALKALEGDTSELGVPSVEKLVAAMDEYIPVPDRAVDQPFFGVDRRCVFDLGSWHGGDRSHRSRRGEGRRRD